MTHSPNGENSTTLQNPNQQDVKASVRYHTISVAAPVRVSIAGALYASLPESEFQKIDAHEQAVVLELGAYALQEATDIDSAIPSETSNPTREKNRTTAEVDAFLRMSLGHERFNHLSALAAANRNEQMKQHASPSDALTK